MTIDGDTSTSDTCLLFATGAAAKRGQQPVADAGDPRLEAFGAALHDLMRELAIQVAKDGEGLTKFVTIEIGGRRKLGRGAARSRSAFANSPLVKTAIAGEDPNWGRVVMAVGKAGEAADRDKLSIWFGPHIVARNGERAAEYVEETVAAYMKGREIVIRVDVGVGTGHGHGVDLRPHPRLHLDQRGLPQLNDTRKLADHFRLERWRRSQGEHGGLSWPMSIGCRADRQSVRHTLGGFCAASCERAASPWLRLRVISRSRGKPCTPSSTRSGPCRWTWPRVSVSHSGIAHSSGSTCRPITMHGTRTGQPRR